MGLDIGNRSGCAVIDIGNQVARYIFDQLVLVNPVCDFLVAQVDGHCIISCCKFYCRRGSFSQSYLAGRASCFQVKAAFQVIDVRPVVLNRRIITDTIIQLFSSSFRFNPS